MYTSPTPIPTTTPNATRSGPGRLRAAMLTGAIAGGLLLGATQVGAVANAQTDTDAPPANIDAEARAERRAARQADRQELADLLGVEVDDLAAWLRGGGTIADLADENGVAQSAVVDLIVGQIEDRLANAVDNGRLTEEEAAAKAAEAPERVTTRITEGRPERGDGGRRGPRGGGEGPGRGGRGGDEAPADAPPDVPVDAPVTTEG